MGTAHFYSGTDRSIGTGTWTYNFNPSGDTSGATVEEVRFRFFIDYNNGSKVDLGDVDIWLRAPDGDQDRIYYNFDGIGADTDDGNDSDPNNDYDISFWGTDLKSKTPFALDGAQVNGTWKLIVKNDTGKTLDLDFLEVWVDYNSPVDYRVKDIDIIGTQQVGQPVIISATIDNIGDRYKAEYVKIEYLVEGKVIGSSALTAGLLPGQNKVETELHSFDKVGLNDVQVRIVGAPDINTSNNARTEYFNFEHNQPDLAVTDISIIGNQTAGSNQLIKADVKNVGNATHTGPVLLEYLVDGAVIGTQTIGLAGANIMLPGTTNSESELFAFKIPGNVDVQVRIANPDAGDWSSANDSRTETFFFDVPAEQPDLTITDLRVIGGWDAGSSVNLRAHIENIGDEGWNLLLGQPQVEYFVRYDGDTSWTSVGTDVLSLGLPSGGSDWEDVTFTLAKDGPFEVRADVSGNDSEKSYLNNSKSEFAGFSRADAPKKTIANSAEDVELAMLLARTVYGGVGIPEDYRDAHENGLKDDYRGYLDTIGFDVLTSADFGQDFRPVDGLSKFYSGGLFAGDQGIASSNSDKWQAQGLVAVSNDEFAGPKTMTLTFRGTDSKDLLESSLGQAWTGNGLYDYYESMRPLIDAALAYANDSANGIEKVIVSGHSLGGGTTDAFALVDAHRLNDDIDLTVVSFASSGLNPAFLSQAYWQKGMLGQYDVAESLNPLLVPPSFYIGVSHAIDMVTFPENNPSTPLDSIPGTLIDDLVRLLESEFKIPNETLLANMNMHDALISIETPNMDNLDRPGFNFGSGHETGFYWANVGQIMSDDLISHYSGHRIIAGLSDYSDVPDFDGSSISVFEDYKNYGEAGSDFDSGGRALRGGAGKDYILGFSGNDLLVGSGGHDLLSGGTGMDRLEGGSGNDRLSGGDGDDALFGDTGDDRIDGGKGRDSIYGGTGNDSIFANGDDDRILADSGNDYIDGGAGFDLMDYSTYGKAIAMYLKMDTVFKDGESDTLINVEQVFGTALNDRMVGDEGDNYFVGGAGNDIMRGKGGTDTFSGGSGNDIMKGGSGVDTMDGQGGNDVIATLAGDDVLDGGAGDDFLFGGRDDDILRGGTGNDVQNGNRGHDKLEGGEGDDLLRGGGGNDDMQGGLGKDALLGGSGSDVLEGGAGNDTLWGGLGAGLNDLAKDVFVFDSTAAGGGGFDRIKDFEDGIDVIDLTSFGFTSFATDVLARASDQSGGLKIDFGGGDVLFLEGILRSELDASDVILA